MYLIIIFIIIILFFVFPIKNKEQINLKLKDTSDFTKKLFYEINNKNTNSIEETEKTISETVNFGLGNIELNQKKCSCDDIDFDFFGIKYIYHMTHKKNIPNILKYGILSHNEAHYRKIVSNDIADNDVNKRRAKIHDYVPFYFNPKNPMLYKRKDIQDDIVILCIDRNVLKKECIFTDGNAASSSTIFYDDTRYLNKLNWEIINSRYWGEFSDGKRIRCAEALIRNKVSQDNILEIYCRNENTCIDLKAETKKIKITINKGIYF